MKPSITLADIQWNTAGRGRGVVAPKRRTSKRLTALSSGPARGHCGPIAVYAAVHGMSRSTAWRRLKVPRRLTPSVASPGFRRSFAGNLLQLTLIEPTAVGELISEANSSASPGAAALARQAVDGWLTDLVGDEAAATIVLGATELISNAVRDGDLTENRHHPAVRRRDPRHVRIEVEQPSSAAGAHVVAAEEREDAPHGFGLRIVEDLASDWGIRGGLPGVVWFEVRRDRRLQVPGGADR